MLEKSVNKQNEVINYEMENKQFEGLGEPRLTLIYRFSLLNIAQ